MAYVINKHPAVRIDIMILQKYWPKMVGIVQRTGCTYFKEDWMNLPNGHDYVILRDIKSNDAWRLGNLIGLLYSLEWDSMFKEEEKPDPKTPDKFYILIKPRKKGKKNVPKDRKETGAGSESGNSGESGGSAGSESNSGSDTSGVEPVGDGFDNIHQLSIFEEADLNSDQ